MTPTAAERRHDLPAAYSEPPGRRGLRFRGAVSAPAGAAPGRATAVSAHGGPAERGAGSLRDDPDPDRKRREQDRALDGAAPRPGISPAARAARPPGYRKRVEVSR